jgi:predicted MFS family arabinose efflux permease
VLLIGKLQSRVPEKSSWQPDPLGLALFTIFVTTTILALEQVQQLDRSTLPLLGALLGASVVAFVLHQERRVPSPLIPLSLLSLPAIWRSDALAACLRAALVSFITFLPIYVVVVRGLSPGTTGLLLVPLTIGIGTGSLVTGRLVSKTGRTTIFPVFGLASATVNLVALAFGARVLSTTALGWLLLLHELFMGTVMGVVQVTVQSASGPRRLGEAAASVQFSRSIGAAFGTRW